MSNSRTATAVCRVPTDTAARVDEPCGPAYTCAASAGRERLALRTHRTGSAAACATSARDAACGLVRGATRARPPPRTSSCWSARRYSTPEIAHLEDVSPLLSAPLSLSLREQTQRASALSHPLLEARVQELVPGIDERGMHANRPLIFGAAEPAQGLQSRVLTSVRGALKGARC